MVEWRHMKTEAELQKWCTAQVRAGAWWELLGDAFQYEPKHSHGDRIAFSELLSREHQIKALLRGKSMEGIGYKISDAAAGYKPCDAYAMRNAGGWYVLGFRDGAEVWAIDVDMVIGRLYRKDAAGEIIGVNRGSFTLEWARGCGVRLRSSGPSGEGARS